MTPEQAAHDTRDVLVKFTSGFMNARETYERGKELGFEGSAFYFGGRGGVLGDVPAEVVAASLVFFHESVVRPAWNASGLVMTRRQAAVAFATCAHEWAETHMPDTVDAARLATLLGPIVEAADASVAPLFAGWRLLDEPASPRALVIHRLNALRELRGAVHAAAILTVGLTPQEAVATRGTNVAWFGWPEPYPDPAPLMDRWNLAEARTDRVFGRRLAILDEDERAELVELCLALTAD
ncbi:MAG TPA: hypothetical protein VFR41_06260 [Acidimicrobiia bacterium]|nr:hypothetical protein [Acidimicrobiia bacterium]